MGGGCCIGDCGFCCIGDCGFCCIMDFGSCGDCCVGDSRAPTKSVENKIDVAGELAAMQERANKMALEEETNVINQISEGLEKFLKECGEVNCATYGGRKLNINIADIREENQKLKDEVRGFIGRRMADRLVQTDKELSVILKETNTKNRKKNFEGFYQRVMRKAMKELEVRISETGKKQREMVEKAIKQRLGEVNAGMKRTEREYKELLAAHKNNKEKVAQLQVDYMYRLDVCNTMLDQIEAAKKL